ncbi:HD domain-containing protein [Paraburkholderia sp. UCT31]|uniref:hypothetical protein n=1 Tax=Paraburkholderia sp. UCT31 TaxID=2615209 RepID=UPI001655DC6F|nr:hypothetical protein [Paraburkholderia sp. UCT31]MBC8737301.1 HD domain-containing protein [Paraburkholderia sp. UCT31]
MAVALHNLPKPDYHKLYREMEKWLTEKVAIDPEYQVAMDAFHYAHNVHTSGIKRNGEKTTALRKDGLTPEFQHQLEICHFITTLVPSLARPAQTLATGFLHDVPEDYLVEKTELLARFGEEVVHSVYLLNKYDEAGNEKDADVHYQNIAADVIAAFVKGVDCLHNQSTMQGVFTLAKMFSYVQRCEKHILPMLKSARKRFPSQREAYENLKFNLRVQCQMSIFALNAAGFSPAT